MRGTAAASSGKRSAGGFQSWPLSGRYGEGEGGREGGSGEIVDVGAIGMFEVSVFVTDLKTRMPVDLQARFDWNAVGQEQEREDDVDAGILYDESYLTMDLLHDQHQS